MLNGTSRKTPCVTVVLKEKSYMCRGLLSSVCSVYDPMGHISPCLLIAKQLVQELHRQKIGWDDSLPENILSAWRVWLNELPKLEALSIPRCIKSVNSNIVSYQLHHFNDASQAGYGAASYMRMIDTEVQVTCKFLLAMSRLAPLRQLTIPRLELSAVTVAVKLDLLLRNELCMIALQTSVFWTDSNIVLQYIRNESLRLHTFVANRVALIREHSSARQWHHVDTKNNPADDVSRGLTASELLLQERWLDGPPFFKLSEEHWPSSSIEVTELSKDDAKVRNQMVFTVQAQNEQAVDDCNDILDNKGARHFSSC